MSLKARGLLALLMSHTPGWSVSIARLIEENLEGRDSIKAAVTELETLGYLERMQPREGGKFAEAIWMTASPATDSPATDYPSPVYPHPKNTTSKNTTKKREGAGATLLPKDWKPSEESLSVMREHFPWLDLKLETHKFRDYWSAATKSARKKDWEAAWRNWIRRAAEWNKPKDTPRTKHRFTLED